MARDLIHPPKARAGDAVAVVSPSFAAPERYPAVHDQAMQRLADLTGLVPVEYPSTRRTSTPQQRAHDLDEAFADPAIRAVLAVIGGEDQIMVIPHLDPGVPRADPKPFLGYSDNTNLLNWLWGHGVAGFHGGSTQVHLGPGPSVDDCHVTSLRAALLTGGRIEITEPGESEDIGKPWDDSAALTDFGDREPTEPWTWGGPSRSVSGPSWGGCVELIPYMLTAGRFPADPAVLESGILLLETSELLIPTDMFVWILRSIGERGLLAAADGVLVARPPTSDLQRQPSASDRAAHRRAQRDAAIETIAHYNPDAVVCVGVPFGHTRPQWILPYGGSVTLDGTSRSVWADYD